MTHAGWWSVAVGGCMMDDACRHLCLKKLVGGGLGSGIGFMHGKKKHAGPTPPPLPPRPGSMQPAEKHHSWWWGRFTANTGVTSLHVRGMGGQRPPQVLVGALNDTAHLLQPPPQTPSSTEVRPPRGGGGGRGLRAIEELR